MSAEKQINDKSLEEVSGGYRTDEDGNVYFMDLGIDADAYICCGDCIEMCPLQCISSDGNTAVIDYDVCLKCDQCINTCPVGAIGDYRKVIIRHKEE